MDEQKLEVECLSCNARSEAESLEALGPSGDWRCPHCRYGVGAPASGDSGTAP